MQNATNNCLQKSHSYQNSTNSHTETVQETINPLESILFYIALQETRLQQDSRLDQTKHQFKYRIYETSPTFSDPKITIKKIVAL